MCGDWNDSGGEYLKGFMESGRLLWTGVNVSKSDVSSAVFDLIHASAYVSANEIDKNYKNLKLVENN